jgi:hypothetical protein
VEGSCESVDGGFQSERRLLSKRGRVSHELGRKVEPVIAKVESLAERGSAVVVCCHVLEEVAEEFGFIVGQERQAGGRLWRIVEERVIL